MSNCKSARILVSSFINIAITLVGSANSQSKDRDNPIGQTKHNSEQKKASQKSLNARKIAQRAYSSVVLLIAEDVTGKPKAFGSGFFVKDDIIVTNYHVIEDASRVQAKIVGQNNLYDILGTIGVDQERDLVLLKVKGILKSNSLPLATTNQVSVGDEIYVLGNPEGLEGTFSQGIISALRGNQYIQITAPISQGSSGSPVLNQRGEVIGVAVGGIADGQNLNFAIPTLAVTRLINNLTPITPIVAKAESRFDSKYVCNDLGIFSLFRFYKDGVVIMAETIEFSEKIRAWFNRDRTYAKAT